MMHKHLYM